MYTKIPIVFTGPGGKSAFAGKQRHLGTEVTTSDKPAQCDSTCQNGKERQDGERYGPKILLVLSTENKTHLFDITFNEQPGQWCIVVVGKGNLNNNISRYASHC